jgi:hypothetical protein
MEKSPLQYHSLVEIKQALVHLSEDRAFLHLNTIIQSQVDALQQEILFNPCGNVDSLVVQEYKKGQLEGRLSWAKTLETVIENLTLDIQNSEGTEDDDRDSDSD